MLPKTGKALFRCIVNGGDKPCKKVELIRCEKCYLTVHKDCYGGGNSTSWICERCENESLVIVSNIQFCSLCFI